MENVVFTINNFLSECEVEELLSLVFKEKDNFIPTVTTTPNVEDYRKSTYLNPTYFPYELFQKFKNKIHSLIPEVCKHLLHPKFEIDENGFEAQLTQSGNEDFYKVHDDNGCLEVQFREITFVYYFNFPPKRFRGGELQIYTTNPKDLRKKIPDKHSFYVSPIHNTIVFFDSNRKHQVLKVFTASNDFTDSRFTFNGWVHRKH